MERVVGIGGIFLRSAEPVPESHTDREQPHLVADQKVDEMAAWVRDLAAQR